MPQNVTMTDSRLTEMSGESEDRGQGSGWGSATMYLPTAIPEELSFEK